MNDAQTNVLTRPARTTADGYDIIYAYTRAQAIEDGVLVVLRWAIRASADGTELIFSVWCNRRDVRLQIVTGPGDDGDPVMTIMLPEED